VEKPKLAAFSLVLAAAAWIVGIFAILCFYDYWGRFLDGVIMSWRPLRPYGVWFGSCPLVLFCAASVVPIVAGCLALRRARRPPSSGRDSLLAGIAIILGGIGVLVGLSLVLIVAALLCLAIVTGHF
jgi:hypothetical protein